MLFVRSDPHLGVNRVEWGAHINPEVPLAIRRREFKVFAP
jgi:hypothetical protein